jgi:circadian clock protein KaiC
MKLDRISTGIAELDRLLDGGIPKPSVTVIAGEPGSGKTVLALAMMFHAARHGAKCLYFTTLSEPAMKLIRHMQLFEFFDGSLLEEKIVLADLGALLRGDGAEKALAHLLERVEAAEPDLVIVDSFKAIHDLVPPSRERTFVYDLVASMAAFGTTTLLLGEYDEPDVAQLPEIAIADGILRLGYGRRELTTSREIEIQKLRGSDFVAGKHFFDITAGGLVVYPRLRAPAFSDDADATPMDPVPTGVAGLDRMLRGGLPRASATVVLGGTGTGKTVLGLSFLAEGVRRGEPSVLFTLEETPAQIRGVATSLGWNMKELEASGLLRICYTSPVELSPDRFLHRARAIVGEMRAQRVVIDSLTTLELGAMSAHRFKELVYALMKHLRVSGATSVMQMEIPELVGSGKLSGHGVSFAADNALYLRFLERQGRLERAAVVVKARGVDHANELCGLTIGPGGMRIGDPLEGMQGVLTGVPIVKPHSERER